MDDVMIKNETRILVRDLKVQALLGLFPQEIGTRQTVVINVEATLTDYKIKDDTIDSTMSYAPIIEEVHRMSARQFSLAEKFADHIADFVFQDSRIASVKVRVEKHDIFPEAIVGAEIVRTRA